MTWAIYSPKDFSCNLSLKWALRNKEHCKTHSLVYFNNNAKRWLGRGITVKKIQIMIYVFSRSWNVLKFGKFISNVAWCKLCHDLWYLFEEIVKLSFFDIKPKWVWYSSKKLKIYMKFIFRTWYKRFQNA